MDIFKRFKPSSAASTKDKTGTRGHTDPRFIFYNGVRECEATGTMCAFYNTGVVISNHKYSDKAICHACLFGHVADEVNCMFKERGIS